MDIQQILIDFGAYYIGNENKQNRDRLVKKLYQRGATFQSLSLKITDDTVWRASEATIDRLLQPFQKQWTPLGTVSFEPVEIKQFQGKIDFEDNPHELEASWLGFLADHSSPEEQWPYIRWFMEEHMLAKVTQEYELDESYKGVYAAPVSGTPGAKGTVMNGLEKIMKDFITAGRITPIVTGAAANDERDFVKQVEEFVEQIGEIYLGVPMDLCMSTKLARRYSKGYKSLYGRDLDYKAGQRMSVDDTFISILGLPSMVGRERMWATPKENKILLTKKTIEQMPFQIQQAKRNVALFADVWYGVGFQIPEIVFTNDVD